jgi:hypothetical protein
MPPKTFNLTIITSSLTQTGTYNLIINATGGGIVKTENIELKILSKTSQNVTLTLYIHENDLNGQLLSGVRITGKDGGGNPFDQTTNSSGYVTITGVPGNWNFTASKSGYTTNMWTKDITSSVRNDGYIVKSVQPYFKVLVDRGCGSTYNIGDTVSIVGESNVTASGTLYSYWSDGSVKTYQVSFTANQMVMLYSSPLAGATGLRRYKAVVSYNGATYESTECSINIVNSGGIYIGASVKTTANVNVRSGPGLSYSTIVTLPPNVYGTVIGGPSNSDGYVWWYCSWSYNGTTYTGWSVENYISP